MIQSIVLVGALAVVVAFASCGVSDRGDERTVGDGNTAADVSTQSSPKTVAALSPALSWDLPQVGGERLRSEDLAGNIVIIDFWATWCPPCRAEIPGYVELQEAFSDKGVVFVGVSLDEGPTADAKVQKFIDDYKINYPIVIGDAKVVQTFGGIEAVPTTFVIGRDGQIAHRKVGYKPKAYFEDLLNDLL